MKAPGTHAVAAEHDEDDDREVEASVGYDGVHHQHYVDPLTPLPGAIKLVKNQRAPRRKPGAASAARDLYSDYLRALVNHGGDDAAALAETLDIPREEAARRRSELRGRILADGDSGHSLQDMLKTYDLGKRARLAILRAHAYSAVPAASLKAVDMLNEIDQGRATDTGSYESWLRTVMAGRKDG